MGSGGGCRDCSDRHPILGRIPIVGKVFRNTRESSRSISKQEQYEAENAPLEQTINVQQDLTNFRTKCERECDALEESVLNQL